MPRWTEITLYIEELQFWMYEKGVVKRLIKNTLIKNGYTELSWYWDWVAIFFLVWLGFMSYQHL